MKLIVLIIGVIALSLGPLKIALAQKPGTNEPLVVKKCLDYNITGTGDNRQWDIATWYPLIKLDRGGTDYESKFKIMYSVKGIYLLFEGMDNRISTKYDRDFDNLFEGDVFEVFFHPDPAVPIYFEYEINQLNRELVLLIPNLKGRMYGWIPWHYENERKVIKKVSIVGGEMANGSKIKLWQAELFFPFELFNPLSNVPPASGTIWNANFYRLDYDSGKMIKWAWAPVDHSFHEFKKFQPIRFE